MNTIPLNNEKLVVFHAVCHAIGNKGGVSNGKNSKIKYQD